MKFIHEKKNVFLLYLTIVLTGFTLPEVLAGAGDSIIWEDPVLFNSPVAHPSGPRFGDFNNDGYTDLYFCHYDEGKMTCYLNNGDGTFQYTGTYTMEVCPHGSVVSDVNNDGNPDLIFANSDAGLTHGGPYEGISVFFGNGDGTFQPYQFYDPYGSFTYSVDAGDINNDGYRDLVIASAGWDGFSILLNDGDGSFSEGNHYAGAREASVINLGDFNGDGELDVALSCGGYGQGYEVGIYLGNGDGTFQNRVSYASPVSQGKPYCKGVFDLDNQNGPDLVFSISYNFYIMRNDGSGAFSFELVAQNFYPTSVCDRDNDGNVDVFARKWSETAEDYTGEYIFTNDGAGIFTPVDLSIDIDATEAYAGNFGVNNAMGIGFSDQTSGSCGVYLQSGLPALNADFTADNTNVIPGAVINFTDLSTGFPVLWEWDFENDGMIDSYEQNPSWTYSEPGVYTVMLRIYDAEGTEIDEEIKEDYITVEESSSPGFFAYYPFNGNAEDVSGNGFHGIVHGPVLTEDRFGNPNSAYLFDNNYIETPFNWGENITGESAFHIVFWFKANETANMYAIGESGQSQATFSTLSTSNGGSVGVKIKGGTWNGYGSNPYDGNWHMVTMGTDGSNIRWSVDTWISGGNDWGSNLGEYFLIGMEGCNPDLKFRGVIDEVKIYNYILSTDQIVELYNEINTNLLADFEADITEGNMPLTVHFSDLSTGDPVLWQWDFDNDGITDSEDEDPVYTFPEPGQYTVSLTISDGTNEDTETKENYITVTEIYSDWSLVTGEIFPNIRRFHSMSHIAENKVLLFGGSESWDITEISDENWLFDLETGEWTELLPESRPSARVNAGMSFIAENKVLLFGGYDITQSHKNDTWIFDLTTGEWTQLNPSVKPSLRQIPCLSYIAENKVLFFGGRNHFGNEFDDTWIFDLTTGQWTQLNPTVHPSARFYHDMSLLREGEVLLFGGTNGSDETWLFSLDAGEWSQVYTSAIPSGRREHSMANAGDGLVVMFGGDSGDGVQVNDETWIFCENTNNWTLYSDSFAHPEPRADHKLAETSMDEEGRLILFGGRNDSWVNLNDTWKFGGLYYLLPGIEASFSADPLEGNAPLIVQFTDQSSMNPVEWEWDFENDGIIDSYEQNPTWVYDEPGVYSVTLNVSDSLGSTDSITKENYITVLESNYFSDEFVDLNDNQAPEGWELEVLNPVVDLANGRLNAYVTDASGALVRNGVMHDSVNILQLEMDSELKYSYWGISSSFLINFSDTSMLAAFTNYSNYTPNNDRIRTKVYYEKNGSMTVLYDSYYATLFTEFHYIFKISDEQLIYKAIDENSDSAYININITSDSLQNYITLKEITQIRFNAYTTTDNDIWIDNLQIQLNPVNQNQASAQFVVNPGWNLLSVPLQMPDMSALNLFPEAASSIYGFESNYIIADTLNNGAGYWVRFDSSVTKSFAGLTPTDNIPLSSGWNMIGAYNDTISISSIITEPANIIASDIYHFEGAYSLATDLLPGKGYWIKAAQDGEILISPGNMAKAVMKNINKSDWATIKITDAAGSSGKLFIADNLEGSYELPPLPPAGIFDVRFSGDKYVEDLASGREIILRDAEYPVKIKVIGKDIILKNSGGSFNVSLKDGGTITIEDNSINRLVIEENFIPLSYELMQNYPNPFNPSTTIRFTIPEECNVVLNIYNTLGQKVCVLLNKNIKSGYHEVQFDGSALASGLYFYSIKAGDFSAVKKMLLLK